MDISVVLATYKRSDILEKTLSSFRKLNLQKTDWELIVVDNADDLQTNQIVHKFQNILPVRLLVETRPGKNAALNAAIPLCKGDLFVFTDDDIIADPDWLIKMWDGVNRWPGHDVFGGKIIAAWPQNKPPHWGNQHPLNQSLFSLHCPADTEKVYGVDDFLPYGPNMAIRKKIFDKGYRYNTSVGPDGSNTYVMGSETELLKRLKNDGYNPVFLPQAVVQHQIRASQLTRRGLNRRNFRIGLADSYTGEKDLPLFLGAPRYLWKQLILTSIKWCVARTLFNKTRSFELNCIFWRTKGKIYGNCSIRNKNVFIQSIMKSGI